MSAKTFGVKGLMLLAAMAGGCATSTTSTAKLGRPSEPQEAKIERTLAQRLAVGPAVLHAYPEASAGELLLVKVQTGDQRDCLQANAVRRQLIAGNKVEVRVAAGEMACATSRRVRPLKIAWHVHRAPQSPVRMIASVPVSR